MLYQIVIKWDDIAAAAALPSNSPITVLKNINLYQGAYKGNVVGFTYVDNLSRNESAVNHVLINVNSSRFSFPANANQGLFLCSKSDNVDPHLKGHHCFEINNVGGNIDFQLSLQQFNANRTVNNAGTWNTSGFLFLILDLDLEKIE